MAPKDAFGFHEKNKPEGGKNETHRDRRGSCGGIPDKSLLCATRPDPTRPGEAAREVVRAALGCKTHFVGGAIGTR